MSYQLGLDYAGVDRDAPPDTAAMTKAGIRFVYIRRAVVYRDPSHNAFHCAPDATYARDAQNLRDAGILVGAYGYYSFRAGAPSMAEQFANFRLASGEIKRGVDLPPVIDVEFDGNGIQDTGRSKADVFKDVLELVRLHRAEYGCCAIYSSHVQWHDSNGLGGPDDPALDDVVLWQKVPYPASKKFDPALRRAPHVGPNADDKFGYWQVPRPWEDQGVWIVQDEGDVTGAPGFNRTVDVDRFPTLSRATGDKARTAWMQRRLTHLAPPLRGPLNADGIWSQETEDALTAFQSARGLTVDGIVGAATFAALCW